MANGGSPVQVDLPTPVDPPAPVDSQPQPNPTIVQCPQWQLKRQARLCQTPSPQACCHHKAQGQPVVPGPATPVTPTFSAAPVTPLSPAASPVHTPGSPVQPAPVTPVRTPGSPVQPAPVTPGSPAASPVCTGSPVLQHQFPLQLTIYSSSYSCSISSSYTSSSSFSAPGSHSTSTKH